MKRLMTALFCLAVLASAQTATPSPAGPDGRKWLQKVIDVKYANTSALANVLKSLQQAGTDRVNDQPGLHAISVGSYDPSFLKLAEEIIQRYDVPTAKISTEHQHGVEIVAHILLAAPKGSSGDAVPADLEPVAKQLRSVFGYTNIRLLDSALIRGREESGSEVSGLLSELAEGAKTSPFYDIRITKVRVEPGGKANTVVLQGFKFRTRIPYDGAGTSVPFIDVGFETDLSLLEGQKVVVGKSRAGTETQALILVLSARVVE